jgi:hypothetical protein
MKKTAIKEQKVRQQLKQITLRTGKNGYLLDVEGEGYMYFDTEGLINGFLAHVGVGRKGGLTKDETAMVLNAVKEGSFLKQQQDEIDKLSRRVVELKKLVREQKEMIEKTNRQYYE